MTDYKSISFDDDEELTKVPIPRPPVDYKITLNQALAHCQQQARIFNQFKHFPESHPSTKKLRYTGAIYDWLIQQLTTLRDEEERNNSRGS